VRDTAGFNQYQPQSENLGNLRREEPDISFTNIVNKGLTILIDRLEPGQSSLELAFWMLDSYLDTGGPVKHQGPLCSNMPM